MLTADDAGRMDGRVEILRARLFPLDLSRRASDVEKVLKECVAQGLVIPYQWDGKPFLQLSKWQRCSPAKTAKYPDSVGSFRIEYVAADTRDGEKEFVESSMFGRGGLTGGEPIRNPGSYGPKGCGRDAEGIGKGSDRFVSGDGDGDGDGDEGAGKPSPLSPKKRRAKGETLTAWADSLTDDAVPAADPIFDWAQSVGIPREWIAVAWWIFEGRYTDSDKAYSDWRAVFRKAVREDWLKAWRQTRSGEWELTTAGVQAQREMAHG
ncbi:hypothetical protein [Luteimonas cucumeris]|nr:hypothetical protein [Luteimonas cucumeris]